LYPLTAEVLALQVRLTLCATVVTPVPERETLAGELPALLVIEAAPLALPFAAGENPTAKEVVAPALTVKGVATLLLNPGPVTATDETEASAAPVFESVTVRELLVPTFTLPNESNAGDAFRIATGVVTPVPVNESVFGDPLRLLAIAAEPVALPVVVGLKTTLAVKLVPGVMLSGNVIPPMLKAEPVIVIEDTTTLSVPVFVTITAFVLVVPTVALPKESELGDMVAETVPPGFVV
jgi:hypothetical protein